MQSLKKKLSVYEYHITTRITGLVLIAIGIGFFLFPSDLHMKLGFSSILIGILMVFIIAKKNIESQVNDIQIKGTSDAIRRVLQELHLKGNAIFIPKTEKLSEERMMIPPNNATIIQVPNMTKDTVFLLNGGNKILGLSLPPSGLHLLAEIEKEQNLQHTIMDHMNEKLQIFVGMGLMKSLSLNQVQSCWELELEQLLFCPKDRTLCTQYPCPTCSAILTAIARTANDSESRLWIKDVKHNGKKTTFYLYFIKRKRSGRDNTC